MTAVVFHFAFQPSGGRWKCCMDRPHVFALTCFRPANARPRSPHCTSRRKEIEKRAGAKNLPPPRLAHWHKTLIVSHLPAPPADSHSKQAKPEQSKRCGYRGIEPDCHIEIGRTTQLTLPAGEGSREVIGAPVSTVVLIVGDEVWIDVEVIVPSYDNRRNCHCILVERRTVVREVEEVINQRISPGVPTAIVKSPKKSDIRQRGVAALQNELQELLPSAPAPREFEGFTK